MNTVTFHGQQTGQMHVAQIAAQDPEIQYFVHGETLPVIVVPNYAEEKGEVQKNPPTKGLGD